jgi:phage FluMu protein Com
MARDPRPSKVPPRPPARMVPHDDQCRCSCGSLLARVVAEGLELKCRKCKSLVLITHDELVRMYQQLEFEPSLRLPTDLIRRL